MYGNESVREQFNLMGRVVSGSYEIRDIDAVLDDVMENFQIWGYLQTIRPPDRSSCPVQVG